MNSYLEPLDRAQEHVRRHYPVWSQHLGSESDATASFQHLLRRGGHPEADDAEAFQHPTPGWHQSQLGRGDVGQLTAALHPHRWDYGTLAHETAHALHQHASGHSTSREHAHDDDFMEHYRNVGNMIAPGAGDALHEAYHHERYGSRLGFRAAEAQERFRCPCGIPVEYDPQDGWQHADGSISHDGEFYPHSVSDLMEEHGGHTAGKGKPRRDAPDVARGAGQAGQGPSGGVAPDSGRDGDGGKPPAPLRALAEHPKVARDLAKLPKNVQAAYHERVDGLRRGEPHSSTHALSGPLKGWQGTNLNFLNRVVHRYDGGELHVLSAGNHDEAYDQGARRMGKAFENGDGYTFEHVEHPLWGQPAIVAHHPDAGDDHGFANHAGHIMWHRDQKHVGLVFVDPEHQRRGLATELWNRAKAVEPEIKHSPRQSDEGRDWAATTAGRHLGALSDEDRVSVAEEAMERAGHVGQHWHVPAMHQDDPAREEAHRPVHEFVNGVLKDHGHPGGLRVHPRHWDLRGAGSGKAITDGHNYIGLAGEHTNNLTLLHEVAHVLSGTAEGHGGHGPAFQDTAHRLYRQHLGPQAAETFARITRPVREGRYAPPKERLFGPTFGLDTRLWESDKLRPAVREDVITRFDAFCHEHGYEGWHRWAKIVFFGSEASEWTSKTLVGNGDFDLSIGVHYPALRATVPGFAGLADEIIATGLTNEMHAELNDPQHRFPGVPGAFDLTWFQNQHGWDIREIRPYAAYDVTADEWIVRPPHLPDWSMTDFPEGKGLADEVHGIVLMAEGILKMPEPYRTQNGSALWEFVHSNRSDAFSSNGEGWWDSRNVVEKALDQKGLMQKLWECHDRAQQAPGSLASPSNWSNSPIATR